MKAAKAVRDAAEEAENKGKGKKAQQGTAASSSTDGLARTVAKSRETAASGGKGGAASTS